MLRSSSMQALRLHPRAAVFALAMLFAALAPRAVAGGAVPGAANVLFEQLAPVLGEVAVKELLSKLGGFTKSFRSVDTDKKVMLVIHTEDENPTNKVWDPRTQELAEVLGTTGVEMKDVRLSAEVSDGPEQFTIDVVTREDVESLFQFLGEKRFLKVNVSLVTPSTSDRLKAKASGAVGSASEWLNAAKRQIVGDVPDEGVLLEAEKNLTGQKVFEGFSHRVVALEDEGYNVSYWPTAVANIAKSLSLGEDEKGELLLAAYRRSGRSALFHHWRDGSLVSTNFTSYRTIREGDEVHIVYGHFAHQVTQLTAAPEVTNAVSWNGRYFKALPEASPYGTNPGSDMVGRRFKLPVGARIVDADAGDFLEIRSHLIAKYGWNANLLVVYSGQARSWPGYYTATAQHSYGGDYYNCSGWLFATGEDFVFHTKSMRLLVEVLRTSTDSTDLSAQLQRYVEDAARRAWAKLLDLSVAGGATATRLEL